MNDRVRIYELARRMNIANDDIIVTLRELGYDIKSHSSTIDGNTVARFIAAYGKKKQKEQEKAKPVTKSTATKTAAKSAPAAATPQAPIVKPRVLSRYRPIPQVPAEAGEAVNASVPSAAVHTPVTTAVQPGSPVLPAASSVPAVAAGSPVEPQVPAAKARTRDAAVQTKIVDDPETISKSARREKQPEPEVFEAVQPLVPPIAAPPASKEEKTISFEPESVEEDFSPEDKPEELAARGQVVRPVTPSVPIRIAAPSTRATQPRPPKSHRPAPSERHIVRKEEKTRPATVTVEIPKIVALTTALSVNELADKMAVPETEIIKRLMTKGVMRTVNQLVELELAKELAAEMEYEILTEEIAPQEAAELPEEELSAADQAALVTRPPVVTIMGHVDHGKTSLLDAIRQTKFQLTDQEAGGITQHIGAYHVEVEGEDGAIRQIVFLDTPGHEAFTAMRARGAKATDIAILVVAADDGVMPQTIEAIDHVKAAGVPIIVAVNKIDKADADPDRVLSQLMTHGLLPEKFGGSTVTCEVSAKKRTGLNELLEMILLVADVEDLKANPDKPAIGVIIEAELSRGKGPVATALVENGTLREGDLIVAGAASGRVRALHDDRGERVKAAGPSMPVEVLGLDAVPQAGDRFEVVADLSAAKALVESRRLGGGDRRTQHVSLESLHDLLERGEVKDLNVIVKADVQGTAEAIAESIKKLSGLEVQVRVLRTASGDISENDVNLAASSEAIIIGFNVQPDQNGKQVAEVAGVDIRTYNIIYQITDDLEKAIQGLIQPARNEVHIGTAEVRQTFKFGKNLTIAGCMVTAGKVQRGSIVKIERDGLIVYEGKLDTLKRFKDDAREVAQGFECGMSFDKFNDVQEGDKVNCYVIQETKREITRT